jgi:predicted naringenin-chalcone synthase
LAWLLRVQLQIASMLQLDEHEVDDYLFHPANAAEIDLIDKTLKVLDYAKEPLQSSARKTRMTTNMSTTLSKREATFEVVDTPGEIQ